jgi:hypothetical protein
VYITGLGTLGINAAQVSLYHATGISRHALAEVWLGLFDDRCTGS